MKCIYLSLCLVPLLSACMIEKARPYRQEELQNIRIIHTTAGQHLLTYQPPLETLYHYAGVRWYWDHQALIIQLMRCPIQANCPVDSQPVQDDTIPGQSQVILPTAHTFYLEDGDHRRLLWSRSW